jgi:hypothetical protein
MTYQEAQEKLEMFLEGKLGSFYTSLFDTISKADNENRKKLKESFPELIYVFERKMEYQNVEYLTDDGKEYFPTKNIGDIIKFKIEDIFIEEKIESIGKFGYWIENEQGIIRCPFGNELN